MDEKFQYRLSKEEKNEIAQNLIDILQKNTKIKNQTVTFISNWLRTEPSEKRKAFFDVWEIVLKKYLPTTRPILFRSCRRINKNRKIASFSGSMEFIRRYSKGKGNLIICDTNETLRLEDRLYKFGEYRHTFYPLSSVLKKAKKSGGCGFSEHLLNEFIDEDEYIMKIDLEIMQSFKWR